MELEAKRAARRPTLVTMTEPRREPTVEEELQRLKGTLDKYTEGHTNPTPEVVADLTKAIHQLDDHIIELHRRLETVEASQEEWTTRGWTAPSGDGE